MSFYMAQVGEIIIKSEFREDFGHLFRGEYDKLESGPIADYVKHWTYVKRLVEERTEEHGILFLPFCYWRHHDDEDSWKGKYKTSYDEETGFFTYGVSYNHYSYGEAMLDMWELLDEITEEEISFDSWCEDDSIRSNKEDSVSNRDYFRLPNEIKAKTLLKMEPLKSMVMTKEMHEYYIPMDLTMDICRLMSILDVPHFMQKAEQLNEYQIQEGTDALTALYQKGLCDELDLQYPSKSICKIIIPMDENSFTVLISDLYNKESEIYRWMIKLTLYGDRPMTEQDGDKYIKEYI